MTREDFAFVNSRITSLIQRVEALEESACSPASPAPSDGASASSGGTAGPKDGTGSGTGTAKPTSTPCRTSDAGPVRLSVNQFCAVCHGLGHVGGEECDCVYAVDGQPSDPSAAIRADPGRPKWLTDDMLPLPMGVTEVVRHEACSHIFGGFPGNYHWSRRWTGGASDREDWHGEVYHVPPPQPEKVTPAAASAWEEWENAFIAGPDQPSHWEQFNRWVAAREKAAVEGCIAGRAALNNPTVYPSKPKSDSACCHTGSVTRHPDPSGNNDQSYTCDECGTFLKREAWLNQPAPKPDAGRAEGKTAPLPMGTIYTPYQGIPAPKPRRAPEVVARETLESRPELVSTLSASTTIEVLKAIAAAVRADRGEG